MKISRGNQKTLETNENRNITFKNLWDAANAVLRGKFIATEAFLKKQERYQRNTLTYHLIELKKEEQAKPKVRRKSKNKNQRENKYGKINKNKYKQAWI